MLIYRKCSINGHPFCYTLEENKNDPKICRKRCNDKEITQLIFTCLKSVAETLDESVKYQS